MVDSFLSRNGAGFGGDALFGNYRSPSEQIFEPDERIFSVFFLTAVLLRLYDNDAFFVNTLIIQSV